MKFRLTVRGIVFSALFAALIAVFSLISVPLPTALSPVPITLETLAVMLAGLLLGPWYGFISVALVVVLTLFGLPMLQDKGGLGVLLGPTGGYVWAWPFAALLIGLCTVKLSRNRLVSVIQTFVATEIFGSFFVYVGGVPQLAHVMHWSLQRAMVGGCYPFLIGDLLKAIVATLIAVAVRQVYSPQRLVSGSAADVVRLAEDAH
jgi:biotin transport system substrate-specific component